MSQALQELPVQAGPVQRIVDNLLKGKDQDLFQVHECAAAVNQALLAGSGGHSPTCPAAANSQNIGIVRQSLLEMATTFADLEQTEQVRAVGAGTEAQHLGPSCQRAWALHGASALHAHCLPGPAAPCLQVKKLRANYEDLLELEREVQAHSMALDTVRDSYQPKSAVATDFKSFINQAAKEALARCAPSLHTRQCASVSSRRACLRARCAASATGAWPLPTGRSMHFFFFFLLYPTAAQPRLHPTSCAASTRAARRSGSRSLMESS